MADTSPDTRTESDLRPLPDEPVVSAILNIYTEDRLDCFRDALSALLAQTYRPLEIVVVVDADHRLYEDIEDEYGVHPEVKIHYKPEDNGISSSRNYGAEKATGDIVAFTDDDAQPQPDWVAELVDTYQRHDALAVGGPAEPIWDTGKRPRWLPEEFNWLVGLTDSSFPDEEEGIRNTYACNLSFRRSVFLDLDGFETELGKQYGIDMQGEEAGIGLDLQNQYDESLIYAPDAVIKHRVFESQTSFQYLFTRSFWHGYSKAILSSETGASTDGEYEFLSYLAIRCLHRAAGMITSPGNLLAILMILLYTFSTGLGFLHGLFPRPFSSKPSPGKQNV